ncbi:MAG: alpha/beta hydrolase fold domain-containing protein [Nitrospina sp.]|jgi:hypothetical protein|nr:alpha/beta hydrolase fold domain-containing protein [Nitrospina sp.]
MKKIAIILLSILTFSSIGCANKASSIRELNLQMDHYPNFYVLDFNRQGDLINLLEARRAASDLKKNTEIKKILILAFGWGHDRNDSIQSYLDYLDKYLDATKDDFLKDNAYQKGLEKLNSHEIKKIRMEKVAIIGISWESNQMGFRRFFNDLIPASDLADAIAWGPDAMLFPLSVWSKSALADRVAFKGLKNTLNDIITNAYSAKTKISPIEVSDFKNINKDEFKNNKKDEIKIGENITIKEAESNDEEIAEVEVFDSGNALRIEGISPGYAKIKVVLDDESKKYILVEIVPKEICVHRETLREETFIKDSQIYSHVESHDLEVAEVKEDSSNKERRFKIKGIKSGITKVHLKDSAGTERFFHIAVVDPEKNKERKIEVNTKSEITNCYNYSLSKRPDPSIAEVVVSSDKRIFTIKGIKPGITEFQMKDSKGKESTFKVHVVATEDIEQLPEKKLKPRPIYLVGHSFGGRLLGALAETWKFTYSGYIKGVVLIQPAMALFFAPEGAKYPTVITQSRHDHANSLLYPLASLARNNDITKYWEFLEEDKTDDKISRALKQFARFPISIVQTAVLTPFSYFYSQYKEISARGLNYIPDTLAQIPVAEIPVQAIDQAFGENGKGKFEWGEKNKGLFNMGYISESAARLQFPGYLSEFGFPDHSIGYDIKDFLEKKENEAWWLTKPIIYVDATEVIKEGQFFSLSNKWYDPTISWLDPIGSHQNFEEDRIFRLIRKVMINEESVKEDKDATKDQLLDPKKLEDRPYGKSAPNLFN